MTLCYVTAFLDIGRDNWNNFSRSTSKYFQDFIPHLFLFQKEPNPEKYRFLVFLDKKLENDLKKYLSENEKLKELISLKYLCIALIDEEILSKTIKMWNKLDRETEIINSLEYKSLVSNRLYFPENKDPKYTLINHSKVDFVSLALDIFPEVEMFCWVDFGFFSKKENIPKRMLSSSLFPKDKITYTTINPINELDKSLYYTLIFAPEKIGGFFFIGGREAIKKYQNLFHKIHDQFQSLNIVDDDQHIALRCYFEKPELFSLENLGWHRVLCEKQVN